MSSAAGRSLAVSASLIRPTSPYLNVPPLAHLTTSAIGCFLDVATRRATVRNSLRSNPLPLDSGGGVTNPFSPNGAT